MSYALRWLLAFAFTQVVEMGVYVHAHDTPRPRAERLAIAFACSGITHPLVWFAIPEWIALAQPQAGWWQTVGLCEAFAVLAEAGLLTCFGVARPWAWALLANGSSFALGLFGYLCLAWP